MESQLETVALFSLKLAYETEGSSPILRDDLVMGDYQRDVFELLVRRGDVATIKGKMAECVKLALEAIGGAGTPLGRELNRLSVEVNAAQTLEQLDTPLSTLKDYLKDIL
jgi:hydroxyethylthiazole kinase-like sugar kinase family protein